MQSPRLYFTSQFIWKHVFVGEPGECKKRAENIFMRRRIDVSTVLCLTPREFRQLAGEVYRRQTVYQQYWQQKLFVSQHEYTYFERGGDEAHTKPSDKQRAKLSSGRICYGVRPDRSTGLFMVNHFHPLWKCKPGEYLLM